MFSFLPFRVLDEDSTTWSQNGYRASFPIFYVSINSALTIVVEKHTTITQKFSFVQLIAKTQVEVWGLGSKIGWLLPPSPSKQASLDAYRKLFYSRPPPPFHNPLPTKSHWGD